MSEKKNILMILLFAIFFLSSCDDITVPKPRGYYRVDFPEKNYKPFIAKGKFKIQIPDYAKVDTSRADSGWYNIDFPKFNAIVYITYRDSVNTDKMVEESRSLVYKHTVKADDIVEQAFINAPNNVYGSIYEIKGNAATSLNFHLIDSVSRYFRGSLYFGSKPNKDSLAPSIKFIENDVKYMMEKFEWDKNKLVETYEVNFSEP